jgi:hypothetical protein
MSEKKTVSVEERVNPIRITLQDSGETYELDFNRESVRFAEMHGFELENVTRFPASKIPEFFYFAFRMNHKKLSRTQVDDIFDEIGGVTGKMLSRMIALYNQAALTHVITTDEDYEKNARVTVEM